MKIFLRVVSIILLHQTLLSQSDGKKIFIMDDLELIKISEHTYIHVSYFSLREYGRFSSNGLILISGNKTFLFDTPMTEEVTKQLVSWIQDTMKLKITGFIPNHWHDDCIVGLEYLQSLKIESYANELTIEITKSKQLPVPTHGFKDSLQLPFGNKKIECYYLGAGHSSDNIVVWIPSEKILFGGCMIKAMSARGLGNIADADLNEWPHTIDKVLSKFQDAKIVIPGHGEFGGIELLRHTKTLLSK